MSESKPRVIAFLSGKGGSGKTTTAIAIAKLLADMGFKTLLIDFDLATNGASYFFKSRLTKDGRGVWEYLAAAQKDEFYAIDNFSVEVSKNLDFLASRANLIQKGQSYDAVRYEKEWLQSHVLEPLLSMASSREIAYVLIDCQAGFAISSVAAAEVADMAIIVTEADAISSDAAENLLIQMGASLPDERRYLVNKIDVRDAETYRNMRHVFQSMNRLPPLPFDFNVRNAFGSRQIPVDVDKASPLLFALFETLNYAFPEISEKISEYKTKHMDTLFTDYDSKLQELLAQKEAVEKERRQIEVHSVQGDYIQMYTFFLTCIAVVAPVILFLITRFDGFYHYNFLFFGALMLVVGIVTFIIFSVFTLQKSFRRKRSDSLRVSDISHKLENINDELMQVRSLLWTRSKEYLVEAELSKPRELVSAK